MTDNNHPITPPDELVMEWINKHYGCRVHRDLGGVERAIATQAARWGADMELEACCEWFSEDPPAVAQGLRAARRPNWPSLKEQALCHLESFAGSIETLGMDSDLIRCALEALPD